MGIIIKDIKFYDINIIKKIKLKKTDIEELLLLNGNTSIEDIIKQSILQSIDCRVIEEKDTSNIIGVFGLGISNENYGIPWLLTTDKIKNNWFNIAKYSKKIINEEYLKLGNNYLYNLISKKNKVNIKYLKFVGFDFQEYNKDILLFTMNNNK